MKKLVHVKLPRLQCSKCGHIWIPEKEVVFECPKCKCPLEKYPPKVLKGELEK